jgi:hypothetical protein
MVRPEQVEIERNIDDALHAQEAGKAKLAIVNRESCPCQKASTQKLMPGQDTRWRQTALEITRDDTPTVNVYA